VVYLLRFSYINQEYPKQQIQTYQINETLQIKNLEIIVLSSSLYDTINYIKKFEFDTERIDELTKSIELIMVAELEIKYLGNDAEEGVQLLNDFIETCSIQSNAFSNGINFFDISALNPDNTLEKLRSNGNTTVLISFSIPKSLFTAASWGRIHQRDFYLTIGCYPVKNMVALSNEL